MTITISRAALHDLLTDAHVALVENRPAWTGAVLHVLRRATAPEAATPQGLARRLVEQPATGPAPSLAAEEAQPAHQHHMQDGPGEELPPTDAPPSAEAPPIPAPAPEPAQAGGFIPAKLGHQGEHERRTWTDARIDILRTRYRTEGLTAECFAAFNALPGPQVRGAKSVHAAAKKYGIRIEPAVLRRIAAESAAKARATKLARLAERAGKSQASKWTRERIGLLAEEWPTCTDRAALMERLNALPGEPFAHVESVRQKAKELAILATPETLRHLRAQGGRIAGAMKRAPAAAPLPPEPTQVIEPPAPALEPEPAEPTPEEAAAIADQATESRYDRVRESLRKALREHRGRPGIEVSSAIASRNGLPLREVLRLLGEVRQEAA